MNNCNKSGNGRGNCGNGRDYCSDGYGVQGGSAECCASSVNIPTNLEDYNEPPYRGTIQQLLSLNIGKTVTIEYLENSTCLRSVTGVVEAVTVKYVILRNLCNNTRQMGDIFAIRFINFHCC